MTFKKNKFVATKHHWCSNEVCVTIAMVGKFKKKYDELAILATNFRR